LRGTTWFLFESIGKRLDEKFGVYGDLLRDGKFEKKGARTEFVDLVQRHWEEQRNRDEIRKIDLRGNSCFCVCEVIGKREKEHVENCVVCMMDLGFL
jgi:hypothetical protein